MADVKTVTLGGQDVTKIETLQGVTLWEKPSAGAKVACYRWTYTCSGYFYTGDWMEYEMGGTTYYAYGNVTPIDLHFDLFSDSNTTDPLTASHSSFDSLAGALCTYCGSSSGAYVDLMTICREKDKNILVNVNDFYYKVCRMRGSGTRCYYENSADPSNTSSTAFSTAHSYSITTSVEEYVYYQNPSDTQTLVPDLYDSFFFTCASPGSFQYNITTQYVGRLLTNSTQTNGQYWDTGYSNAEVYSTNRDVTPATIATLTCNSGNVSMTFTNDSEAYTASGTVSSTNARYGIITGADSTGTYTYGIGIKTITGHVSGTYTYTFNRRNAYQLACKSDSTILNEISNSIGVPTANITLGEKHYTVSYYVAYTTYPYIAIRNSDASTTYVIDNPTATGLHSVTFDTTDDLATLRGYAGNNETTITANFSTASIYFRDGDTYSVTVDYVYTI